MPNCTVARVDVQPHPINLKKGSAIQMVAVGYDIVGNSQHGTTFTWASDNTTFATVSATGVVTGVKKGPANIVATPSSGPTGSSLVNVVD